MKQKTAKIFMSVVALLLVAGMVFSVAWGLIGYADAASKSELQSRISELKNQKSALESEAADIKAKRDAVSRDVAEKQEAVDKLKAEMATLQDQKINLDQQLNNTYEQITLSEELLADLDSQIEDKNAELEQAKTDEQAQYENLKERLRVMYETSGVSTLDLILQSGSLTEMYANLQALADIADYDQKLLDRLTETRAYVEQVKAELEQSYADEQAARDSLMELQEEQQQQEAELQVLMEELNADTEEAQALLDEASAEEEAYSAEYQAMLAEINAVGGDLSKVQKDLNKLTAAEKAAAEAAAAAARQKQQQSSSSSSSSSSTSTGKMVWPCPGYYSITSDYGYRTHPITGKYSCHTGIDIGASKNASIVAAASGTVTTATYSSVWGNYVIVSHGNGLQTLYAHMTQYTVSVGQSVSAGQQIGKVGSTGSSTGNHLHFTVYKDGAHVSPWNYVSK